MLDIQYALIFYIIFSAFGLVGFYILSKVLPKTSKVLLYGISKPLGLIIFAYPIWMLSSAKLLKFNEAELLIGIFGAVMLGFFGLYIWEFLKRYEKKQLDKKTLQKLALGILSVEVGTIILYSIYLLIRSFNPAIEGTEKFMDLMLLSSAGKTDYFPFFDAWWAGKDVNYYYYGFYLFALIANISQVPYAFAYNFALGIIFSQTFVIIFLAIFRSTKNYLSAFFGSALVNLAGNLHYANCVANNFNDNLRTNCFYPKASRILDPAYTINEFPTYSYILGDLHPHVLSLPLFATGLFLLVEIFKEKKFNIYLHIVYGFLIATAGLVNFWDFMTLGGIYGIIFVYKLSKSIYKNRKSIKNYIYQNAFTLAIRIVTAILLAASPFALYFPFFLHFKSPVAGLGFAPEFRAYHAQQYVEMQYPSSAWFQFGMWGFFLILLIPAALIFFILKYKKWKAAMLPIIFFFSAVLLIVFTELFYFKDLFHIANPPYFRANTVFKFTYHSWIIFGVATAIFLHLSWKAIGQIKNLAVGLAVDGFALIFISIIFTLAFMYSDFGFRQAYYLEQSNIDTKIQGNLLTLDGSKYIKDRNLPDYETINWINRNQKERVVIAEAVGGAYTYFARISVNTGMGNILNWETHQWTWRFRYPDNIKDWKEVTEKRLNTGYSEIAATTAEVKTLYETPDLELTKKILKKYNVKYVYIGDQERTTYTITNEKKFEELGEIVFQSGNSKLYRINN